MHMGLLSSNLFLLSLPWNGLVYALAFQFKNKVHYQVERKKTPFSSLILSLHFAPYPFGHFQYSYPRVITNQNPTKKNLYIFLSLDFREGDLPPGGGKEKGWVFLLQGPFEGILSKSLLSTYALSMLFYALVHARLHWLLWGKKAAIIGEFKES